MNYPINNQVMSGSTDGTPITLLRQDVAKKLNHELDNDMESHYSIESIKTTTDIKELVDEINNNIKSKKNIKEKKKSKKDIETETDSDDREDDRENDKEDKSDKKTKTKSNIIEDSIYDGILLLIIYLLMSQGFVKNFLGRYIRMINVNSEGVVPFIGVVIYGLIFVLVFLSIRFVIHKVSD